MNEPSKLAERILDQVADAVICADQSGTVIRWNRACSALFGYSAEEALGQSIELIIPENLRAAHWSGFDAAMTKGATKMSFAVVTGDADSEVLGAVAVARDVTDRVERERAARQSS
jgi:PAS domain S-box-containing protein